MWSTPPAGPAASPAAEPVETTPAVAEPPVPPPEPVPPAPDKRDLSIRIAAVGDIMLGTDYPENHLPDDDGIGFLAGVAPVLAAAMQIFVKWPDASSRTEPIEAD